MRIARTLESFPPDARPSVVALGVFDGVHRGHRGILDTAVRRARANGGTPVACTFDPHPMEILQPERAPLPITTLDERLELIAETGIALTVLIPFTAVLASMEPEAFVTDVLGARLGAREVVVGFNHRFGRAARGDAALLRDVGGRIGLHAEIVPPMDIGGTPVSSSAIRAALQRGDLAAANAMLGRPYFLAGEVVTGNRRGRTIGFPTANVRSERPVLVPPGVYACRLAIDGTAHPAVLNAGVRPTFGETVFTLEAHVLDFSGDLYGRRVRLDLVERLREERKFEGADALVAQIARDVAAARAALGA
ncbi:MAG TPA: bifunctional riboflavin kinase/FAD synthetase [Terriglobales bacterium]|nr:bifunctional riboflavin kinase/FAD synthetase [Terriglobales bacterium]